MELALLVYAISSLGHILSVAYIVSLISSIAWIILTTFRLAEASSDMESIASYHRLSVWVAIISIGLLILIPSERTAYLMIGAYSAQKIAERPETSDIAKDVLIIINSKVKKYAEEAADDLKKDKK